ncbi:MAG: peptidoglycan-binding protein [Enhygromyxa sp.]
MIRHRVVQGDSVAKLAEAHGLAPETIWEHPENAELEALRKDMNVLAPGDVLVIPKPRPREVRGATNERHVFRRRGVPMLFRVQLFEGNEPRREQPFVLEVEGERIEGVTDGEGRIERYLPNRARRGRLLVNEGELELELAFGHMDPLSEIAGVQKRLANLGFDCGAIDGELHGRTLAALRAFQRTVGLPVSGELDDRTRETLGVCHDQPGKLAELAEAAAVVGAKGA